MFANIGIGLSRRGSRVRVPSAPPLRLTHERWGRVPKTYVVCTQDRTLAPGSQSWLCGRVAGIKEVRLNTDHSPFYSDPDGLVEVIDEEARCLTWADGSRGR
jgi:hypothetical protein